MELGDNTTGWEDAVESLVSLEASFDFKDLKKTLPTTNRPTVIQAWVKNARRDHLPVLEDDASTFISVVLKWWNSLQPDWRTLDRDDLSEGGWIKEVKGHWGKIRCPGINGLYSVLACLRWVAVLEMSEKGMTSDEWKMLLEDVVWVMDSISEAEGQPESKKARTA
ncbi:hypothetical protein VKT23_018270 [Stygiomarasmius scandens]|uniref:Uncharacterized protein n=1 Tax=Marasmiellus scandens TaxID=2682957 RepID=A0ABR1ISA5_9AGAR